MLSKLDANCMFWEIPLSENSRMLIPSSPHLNSLSKNQPSEPLKRVKPKTLALYRYNINSIKISADASSYSLAWLCLPPRTTLGIVGTMHLSMHLACNDSHRAMLFSNEIKSIVMIIDKEALALYSTYVVEKVYIMLETDYKPLMGQTNLDRLPPRVLHFRIHLMCLECSMHQPYIPGKTLHTKPVHCHACPSDLHIREDQQMESFGDNIVFSLPADPDCLQR